MLFVLLFACVDVQLVVGALVHACITNIIQCWYTKSSAFKVYYAVAANKFTFRGFKTLSVKT